MGCISGKKCYYETRMGKKQVVHLKKKKDIDLLVTSSFV